MPRSKKQKTNHHSNNQPYSTRNHYQAANDKMAGLSHEEIWDDSALLRSWDDAVKEYEVSQSGFRFVHFIHVVYGVWMIWHHEQLHCLEMVAGACLCG